MPASNPMAFGSNRPGTLAFYALGHGLIETACAGLVCAQCRGLSSAIGWVILYNALAFATRLPMGWVLDRFRIERWAVSAGFFITGLGVLLTNMAPLSAIILSALGTALFHSGAGSLTLQMAPHRAAWSGLFLAPGALGISMGILISTRWSFPAMLLAILLFIATLVSLLMPNHTTLREPNSARNPVAITSSHWLILALFTIVAAGSFATFFWQFPWHGNPLWLAAALAATALGRGLGGILADFAGWLPVMLSSLGASVILLTMGGHQPEFALAALLVMNIPAAVVLAAVSELVPNRPAFSFGLVSMALLMGYLLTVSDSFAHLLIVISTGPLVALFFVLAIWNHNIKRGFNEI